MAAGELSDIWTCMPFLPVLVTASALKAGDSWMASQAFGCRGGTPGVVEPLFKSLSCRCDFHARPQGFMRMCTRRGGEGPTEGEVRERGLVSLDAGEYSLRSSIKAAPIKCPTLPATGSTAAL